MTVREVSVREVLELLKSDTDFVLVDVRSERAYAHGHLPRAISIPDDPMQLVNSYDVPRDVPVVVYCYLGVKSMQVARYYDSLGFRDVRSMRGGHAAWLLKPGHLKDVLE